CVLCPFSFIMLFYTSFNINGIATIKGAIPTFQHVEIMFILFHTEFPLFPLYIHYCHHIQITVVITSYHFCHFLFLQLILYLLLYLVLDKQNAFFLVLSDIFSYM